jgi:hypothetical protein
MNEDDTFRRLRRIPFYNMYKIYLEWQKGNLGAAELELKFIINGWSHSEFYTEVNKHNHGKK